MTSSSETTQDNRLVGRGITPGVGQGIAYRVEPRTPSPARVQITPSQVEGELQRLDQALEMTRNQLRAICDRLKETTGRELSAIISAHLVMLDDPQFTGVTRRRVSERLDSPEKAVRVVADQFLSAFQSADDAFFVHRAIDFEEVVWRILENLSELEPPRDPEFPEDLVLVARKLGISTFARFPLDQIKGLVVLKGAANSHLAIVARSYQIPMVSGIDPLTSGISTGVNLLVDGSRGAVVVKPGLGFLQEYQIGVTEKQRIRSPDKEPCFTRDRERVFVLANTEMGSDVQDALSCGAEGIGLFRSEFLVMAPGDLYKLEKQYETYCELAKAAQGLPAIVRTFDFAEEVNPWDEKISNGPSSVLGLRGIRFSLRYQHVFKAQLRAVLRAREQGDLRLVLPMLASTRELADALRIVRDVEKEINPDLTRSHPVQIGVLIEIPAALYILDEILEQCEFLAVGTNDLIQFLLAVDRTDDEVSDLYDAYHPAVIRSLLQIQSAAHTHQKPAYICGEAAAQIPYTALLVGMGFRHLSMSSPAIGSVKAFLRKQSARELSQLVGQIATLSDPKEIRDLVQRRLGKDEPATAGIVES